MAGCFAASLQACGGETDGEADGGTAGYAAGHAGTGGYNVDFLPGSGGVADGRGGTGGYVVDPLMGSGGYIVVGDGGSPPVVGGRPGSGGRGTGGYFTADFTGGALGVGGRATGGYQGDGGVTVGGYSNVGGQSTGGRNTGGMVDALPAAGGRSTGGYTVVDCAPVAAGTATPSEKPPVVDPAPPDRASPRRELVEQWRDTAPRHVTRSPDLPLFDPPVVKLEGRVEGDTVQVALQSDDPNLSVRWECDGRVDGEGRKVSWQPASSDDALCVAVRGPGGIAVASLRARDLPEPRDR
jgi:hypothetical protein